MRALLCLSALLVPLAAQAGDTDETTITPLAQLQLWGTAFDQDEADQADGAGHGDPEHDPGFSIRRARVGLEGQRGNLDFQIDFGLSAPYDSIEAQGRATPRFEIANAFGRGSWAVGPGTGRVSAGVVRVPFTRERIMSSRDLAFQERAVGIAKIGPAQDLGVLLDYELDSGPRAQIGVYNGGGNLFGDDNAGVMVAGRLEYAKGDTYRTYGEADGIDLGVAVAGYWNDDVATDTVGAEVDALIRVYRFTALVEAATRFIQPGDSTIDLPDALDPTQQLGLTAQVSYWLPLDKEEDDVPIPARSAVEVSVRAATFDDNMALGDNGDVLVLHAGGLWRNPIRGVDLGAGFIHREEIGGSTARSVPNDTVRVWAQLRWPARGVATTATTVPAGPVPAGVLGDGVPDPRTR